jgi:hypothetical protein
MIVDNDAVLSFDGYTDKWRERCRIQNISKKRLHTPQPADAFREKYRSGTAFTAPQRRRIELELTITRNNE